MNSGLDNLYNMFFISSKPALELIQKKYDISRIGEEKEICSLNTKFRMLSQIYANPDRIALIHILLIAAVYFLAFLDSISHFPTGY